MARPKLELQFAQSPVLRYGLAVLSVATALGFLLGRYHFRDAEFPLFLFAIAPHRLECGSRACDPSGKRIRLPYSAMWVAWHSQTQATEVLA